jgi:Na+/melibiose symporter-like transporter
LRTALSHSEPVSQGKTRWGRARDFLLYVAIAISIVILAFAYAFHLAKTGGSQYSTLKWLGFAGITAIVFGNAIRSCRRLWGGRKFWVLLGLFFAVHCGLGVVLLMRVATAPWVLYAVLAGPEYVVLAMYLGHFLDSD